MVQRKKRRMVLDTIDDNEAVTAPDHSATADVNDLPPNTGGSSASGVARALGAGKKTDDSPGGLFGGHQFNRDTFPQEEQERAVAEQERQDELLRKGKAVSFADELNRKEAALLRSGRGAASSSLANVLLEGTQMRLAKLLDEDALKKRGAALGLGGGESLSSGANESLSREDKLKALQELASTGSSTLAQKVIDTCAKTESTILQNEAAANRTVTTSSSSTSSGRKGGAASNTTTSSSTAATRQQLLRKLYLALDRASAPSKNAVLTADQEVDGPRGRAAVFLTKLKRITEDVKAQRLKDGDIEQLRKADSRSSGDAMALSTRRRAYRRRVLLDAIRRNTDCNAEDADVVDEEGAQGTSTSKRVVHIDEKNLRALFQPSLGGAQDLVKAAQTALLNTSDSATRTNMRKALASLGLSERLTSHAGLDRAGNLTTASTSGGSSSSSSGDFIRNAHHPALLPSTCGERDFSVSRNRDANIADVDLYSANDGWHVVYSKGHLAATYWHDGDEKSGGANAENKSGNTRSSTGTGDVEMTDAPATSSSAGHLTSWSIKVSEKPLLLAACGTITLLCWEDHFSIYHTETGMIVLPVSFLPDQGKPASIAVCPKRLMVLTTDGWLYCWEYHGLRPGVSPISLKFESRVTHFAQITAIGFRGSDCVPVLEARQLAPASTSSTRISPALREIQYVWNDQVKAFQLVRQEEASPATFFSHVLLGDRRAANETLDAFLHVCNDDPAAGPTAVAQFCATLRCVYDDDDDDNAKMSTAGSGTGWQAQEQQSSTSMTSGGGFGRFRSASGNRNKAKTSKNPKPFLLRRLEKMYLQSSQAFLRHWVLPKIALHHQLQKVYEEELDTQDSDTSGRDTLVTDMAERRKLFDI
ncbi:unnamed protein product [Amoebophrya sp. A25]|nr:unnamed protein product [Amoebophrya sp. A25]|eukprot:GSA25T00012303001.1